MQRSRGPKRILRRNLGYKHSPHCGGRRRTGIRRSFQSIEDALRSSGELGSLVDFCFRDEGRRKRTERIRRCERASRWRHGQAKSNFAASLARCMGIARSTLKAPSWPGPVSAIHALFRVAAKDVDARHKAGHDEWRGLPQSQKIPILLTSLETILIHQWALPLAIFGTSWRSPA